MRSSIDRIWRKAVLTATGCLMVGALSASVAQANFGIEEFGAATNQESAISRQAGAHPDLRVKFSLATRQNRIDQTVPDEALRNIDVSLPPGLIANPTATETCTRAELVAGQEGQSPICPVTSEVGIARIKFSAADTTELEVFNLEPPAGTPALFGMNFFGAVVLIEAKVRPGDYGIDSLSLNTSEANLIYGVDLELWGVPADPSHDADRTFYTPITGAGIRPASSPAARVPFVRAPTSCPGTANRFSMSANSWQNSGVFSSLETSHDLGGAAFINENCDDVPFRPTLTAQPTSHVAGAPTGFVFNVDVPQYEDPNGLGSADVRSTRVTLPKGVSVSPSAAAGLGACTQSAMHLGTDDAIECPASSRIGSVMIETPLLAQPLEGDVILAKQNDNPFNTLLAMYMAVKGPGLYLKLPGKVELDPQTGQLTASFENTPQLPFSHLRLELEGGDRAPLVAPSTCGRFVSHAEITSWASVTPVSIDIPMTIDEGCGRSGQFEPGFEAASSNPIGGRYSPFTLRVTRPDGQQNIASLKATLPEGLLAKLAGVPLCGATQAATGDCPAGSQVGTTTVGAGPGSSPIYVPEAGKAPTAVYLAGPYKGAPYSLVVKVPAQAGPFDLGTVVVRNALQVDPTTTQVTAESDPLPQILEGIPITYRDVRVEINKPEFTINPTNCTQMAVTGAITSASGQTVNRSAPFAVANCERLDFKPTLALQMSGQTKRAGNPALTATLKAPAGQANIASTAVILPKTVFIDQRHVSNPCTRVQFAADACPAKSILGTAKAWSPLLDKPLEGPVYFRSNGGERQLPDIVADLDGQIHVVLVGFIDSKKVGKETSLVRTRFASVPDAPVSKFVLKLKGGKKSLIQNSANLCKVRPKAEVKMTGQNGKTNDFEQTIAVQCGKAKTSKPKKN